MQRSRLLLLIGGFMLSALLAQGAAAAGPMEDIPTAMSSAMGVSVSTAEMILSVGMILAAMLALAVVRMPVLPILLIMLALMGVLTTIGWLPTWLMALAAILTAALFATAGKTWMTGE